MRNTYSQFAFGMIFSWFGIGSAALAADPMPVVSAPVAPVTPSSVFSLYGFVIPSFIASSAAVESFSQPNQSAYTAAGNPVLATAPTQSRTSFQAVQSRFGFLLKPDPRATGRLEFDFIDFGKASPTTGALPRVRRATVEYKAADGVVLRFGQDWDLVSPLAPHTYNYVGHYFLSGDIGFMRIQAQALITSGTWEHAVAVGLPANNNAAADSLLELGRLPTLAIRETYHWDGGQAGMSALGTSLRKDKVTNDGMFAGAITAFAEVKPSSDFEIHSEAFIGQNTANLGLLGLSFGNATSPSVKEAGAYATARYKFSESSSVFGGFGGSFALDPSHVLASYSTTPGGVSALSGTGPGIESNFTIRAGYEYTPVRSLLFFGEVAGLATKHKLLLADAAHFDVNRRALVFQIGTQLSF